MQADIASIFWFDSGNRWEYHGSYSLCVLVSFLANKAAMRTVDD